VIAQTTLCSALYLGKISKIRKMIERTSFQATVCKTVRFALCYRSVVCPVCLSDLAVCLSATFVYCGQTVGRIKMKLGMQVRLVPGHIVLDVDPALSLLQKGTAPNFRPISVAAKWMHPSRCHVV